MHLVVREYQFYIGIELNYEDLKGSKVKYDLKTNNKKTIFWVVRRFECYIYFYDCILLQFIINGRFETVFIHNSYEYRRYAPQGRHLRQFRL